MKKIDLIGMSVRNLLRRKFRTVLTVLGVVIGASSIILMLSLGMAMDKNLEEQMSQMGDLTKVEVYNYGSAKTIDNKTLNEIKKIQNVSYVMPRINAGQFYFKYGKYRTMDAYWNVYVMSAEDLTALGYEVEEGRLLMENESRSILLGKGALRYFTKNGKQPKNGNWEPMPFDLSDSKMTIEVLQYDWETGKPQLEGQNGKVKKPKNFEVEVVGVFPEQNETGMQIIISPQLYEELKAESIKYRKSLGWYSDEEKEKDKKTNYQEVIVKVNDRKNVTEVVEILQSQGYEVYNNMEWIEEMEQQSKSRQMALGAIGIVSFVVAAIGIANTMMMSIYERTKEIGVMKVIGAKVKDIKYMFLMESLMIGFFGGLFGAVISFLISMIMNASSEKIAAMMNMYGASSVSVMTPELLGAGILFSVVVGLLSGYFPARKAMKLSALSAIKTE